MQKSFGNSDIKSSRESNLKCYPASYKKLNCYKILIKTKKRSTMNTLIFFYFSREV